MDCRSTVKRQWIVEHYEVVPVAHIQLLEGQTKHSDAGATIENDYYIFHAINRITEKREIIQCGMGAAKDFLKLLNHDGLPLFNPLRGAGRTAGSHGREGQGGNGGRRPAEEWNPTARQLYNAIMWLIVIIDAKPDTPIFEIREKVYKYKYKEPFASQVKAVNTIISKNLGEKTITEVINGLKDKNDVRDSMCQFDLLVDIISHYTDKDGNPVYIEPRF